MGNIFRRNNDSDSSIDVGLAITEELDDQCHAYTTDALGEYIDIFMDGLKDTLLRYAVMQHQNASIVIKITGDKSYIVVKNLDRMTEVVIKYPIYNNIVNGSHFRYQLLREINKCIPFNTIIKEDEDSSRTEYGWTW